MSKAKAEKSLVPTTKKTAIDYRIDLPAKTLNVVYPLLSQQLVDTFDLFSQVKQAHWNVKGMNFIALHELFDTFADELKGYTDDIAERLNAIGGVPVGTVRAAASQSRLPEIDHTALPGEKAVAALADRYAQLAASTRAAIDTADEAGDADTADLFTGISRELDKNLWFLQAHLYQ